jgi:hypothetical protein
LRAGQSNDRHALDEVGDGNQLKSLLLEARKS